MHTAKGPFRSVLDEHGMVLSLEKRKCVRKPQQQRALASALRTTAYLPHFRYALPSILPPQMFADILRAALEFVSAA